MKQFWKKSVAAVCAAVCTAAVLPLSFMTASAVELKPVQVLALGDDCLAGTDDGASAVEIVADYLGGTAVNHAQVGATSADLLSDLKNDSDIQRDVAQADVVLVSVGVNDLMSAVFYDNPYLTNAASQTTLTGLIQSMPTEKALDVVQHVIRVLPDTVEAINANIQQSITLIRKQNTAANIVVQTVCNPIAIDFDEWDGIVSSNRQTATAQLYYYLNACLEGGTYTSDYLADSTLTISTGVNEAIENLDRASAADFYSPFVGAKGEDGLAFYLTDIANLRMTFTPVGQVVLAAAAIGADPQLSNGDGSVLTAAYDATGERSNLSGTRATLHNMITAAEANTRTEYALGDVDGNGKIDIQDAYQTLQEYASMSVGYAPDFGPAQRCAADVDGDSSIGIYDAYRILLYYATQSSGGTPSWDAE